MRQFWVGPTRLRTAGTVYTPKFNLAPISRLLDVDRGDPPLNAADRAKIILYIEGRISYDDSAHGSVLCG